MRTLPAVLLVVLGCSEPQARRIHRPAELAIGVSLAGVIASSLVLAAIPAHKTAILPVDISFGALAVASVVTFVIADQSLVHDDDDAAQVADDHRAEAWELTKQAQAAARAGDCKQVRELDARVGELDADFHAVVFARDLAIKSCLAAVGR